MKTKIITHRHFIFFAVFIFTMTFYCQKTIASDKESRPNILFCLADDWGWPHAGAYGDNVVKTPTFDRLANEGVLFERTFVSSPSCTASRNAILTGQQFYRLEEGGNLHSTLDVEYPNFMSILKDHGYEIGHWRKAWGPGDFKAGGYTEHPCGPESTFDEFIANRDSNKPFCFWFGTSDPHRAYEKGSGRKSGMDLDEVSVPEFYPDKEDIRSDIADYYFEVQRWDSDVAKAIQLLEEAGELENTIIVMTGDHGMPFPRCKGNLYDYGTRVPLAIRWGEQVKWGRHVSDFVSFTDFAPTFLDALGINIPVQMTGKSLLPILKTDKNGRIDKGRDFMVYGRERHTPAQEIPEMVGYPSRAIRTDQWLLILNLESDRWPAGVPKGSTHPMNNFSDCDNSPTKTYLIDNKDDAEFSKFYKLSFLKRPPVELYDCDSDKYQINNLAENPEYSDIVRKLRKKLTEYLESTSDPRFTRDTVKFDKYPYRADYIEDYLQKHGYSIKEKMN